MADGRAVGQAVAVPLPGLETQGDVARILDQFTVEMVSFDEALLNRFPTSAEREALQNRNRALAALLRRADYAMTDLDKSGALLRSLLKGYSSLHGKLDETVVNYLAHLQELPVFALALACDDVVHNRIPKYDPGYPPTTPQLMKAAQGHVAKFAVERDRIEVVLGARRLIRPDVGPEQAERINRGLQELAASMKVDLREEEDERRSRLGRQSRERDARDIVDRYAAMGVAPRYVGNIPVSPELLAKYGAAPKPSKRKASR